LDKIYKYWNAFIGVSEKNLFPWSREAESLNFQWISRLLWEKSVHTLLETFQCWSLIYPD